MPRALLTLSVLPGVYAICRLNSSTPVPQWPTDSPFWAIVRTADEISIVCLESCVPPALAREGGWRILKAEGPLDFTLTGIMASIADPLADAGIPIFPIATYETDYVLVKEVQLELATDALSLYGHAVRG